MTYTVNFEQVINHKSQMELVPRTARSIVANHGYLTSGDWAKSLSEDELRELIEAAQDFDTSGGESPTSTEFVLLAMMLAQAEGLDTTDDGIPELVSVLVGIAVVEKAGRLGMGTVHHSKLTFGGDMADDIIFSKAPDLE